MPIILNSLDYVTYERVVEYNVEGRTSLFRIQWDQNPPNVSTQMRLTITTEIFLHNG